MRRREVGADGRELVVAEEFAVLDRLGRMQLPQEVQMDLGLRHRVRLEPGEDHLGVWPEDSGWEESS
jgi:hypothetical protein